MKFLQCSGKQLKKIVVNYCNDFPSLLIHILAEEKPTQNYYRHKEKQEAGIKSNKIDEIEEEEEGHRHCCLSLFWFIISWHRTLPK